jgi:hypothetical protein
MDPEEPRSRIAAPGHRAWLYASLKNDNGLNNEIV